VNKIKTIGRRIFVKPVVKVLVLLNVPPMLITIFSLILAIIAFLFYWRGLFLLGALFLILCGLFDTFDGEVARQTNRVTKIGGFLDSTIDRINEFIIYFGLFLYYHIHAPYATLWVFLALFGSMMVSYTRARGEGLGISPQIGLFERFIRIVFICIGSVLGPTGMVYVLVILTIGTLHTMIHRIIFMRTKSRQS
jgi:CDP-diacylglycerol--glycerol-3-phosphate 3-phosphatidyltransferase